MPPDLPDAGSYSSPVAHHKELLSKFQGWENHLWLLYYFCEIYHMPLDIRYDPEKQGWTFRIGGITPSMDDKLVFFNRANEMVSAAHNALSSILAARSSGTTAI